MPHNNLAVEQDIRKKTVLKGSEFFMLSRQSSSRASRASQTTEEPCHLARGSERDVIFGMDITNELEFIAPELSYRSLSERLPPFPSTSRAFSTRFGFFAKVLQDFSFETFCAFGQINDLL